MRKLKLFLACLLMAVLSIGQMWGANYVKTELSDITSDDVVIIVCNKASGTYAMKNTGATNAGPAAFSVSVSEDAITTNATDILWNIYVSNNQYTLRPNGSTNTLLYCISNNNGLRIGSGGDSQNDNLFVLDNTYDKNNNPDKNYYFKNVGKARWIGVYNEQNWRSYTSINNNLSKQSLSFYVLQSNPNACVEPAFSPVEGDVVSGTLVTLTTTTEDADIYYTMGANPGTPTTSSTKYTNPIEINENTTIKAIAVKEGMTNSTVASASYTIVTPLTTMGQVHEATPISGSAQIHVAISDWYITAVSGNQVWITDAENAKGILLYKSDHKFAVDKKINGVVLGTTITKYNNAPELTSLTASQVEVTDGVVETPAVVTIGGLSSNFGADQGRVVKLENLTYNGSSFSDGNNSITIDTRFYNPTLANGTYHLSGVVFYGQNNAIKIMPRKAADIEQVSGSSLTEVNGLAELKAAAKGSYIVNLTNAVVTLVDGNNAFVEDATAGALIYFNNHGYQAGDCLNGKYEVTTTDYKGKFEITAMNAQTGAAKTTAEIPVTTLTIAQLSADFAAYESMRIKIDGVTVTDAIANNDRNGVISDGANTCILYAGKNGVAAAEDAYVNIIAYPTLYKNEDDPVINQFSVWAQSDIDVIDREDPELAYNLTEVNLTLDNLAAFTPAVLEYATGFDGVAAITYESSDPSIATVGETTGVVEIVATAAGSAVITATFGGNATYNADHASYTINVNAAAAPSFAYYNYVKVTETSAIEDGEYLIVYEAENVAFDGGLEALDAAHNTIAVTIDEGVIASNATTDAAAFTIDVTNGTIRAHMGDYIGVTSYGNGLKQNVNVETYPAHSFSINGDGDAVISIYGATWNKGGEGTMILNYNSNANDKRFRYYKEGSQHLIQLYKKVGTNEAPKADPQLAWDPADDIVLTVGDEFTAPALTYVDGFNGLADVAIESSNPGLAAVNNGVVSLVENATGEATITASFNGNDNYKQGEASYKITVNATTPDPLPAAEAMVIVVEYNSKFYAMSTTPKNTTGFEPIAVTKENGKVIVTSDEDAAAIQWQIALGTSEATFQNGDGKYLACGTNSNTELVLVDEESRWDKVNDPASCYKQVGKDSKDRTFYYNLNNNNPIFRAYTVAGIGAEGYSGAPEFITADKIEVQVPVAKADAELAFDPAEVSLTLGDDFTAPTLNYAEGFNGQALITYTSSKTAVAEVDPATGEVTIKTHGTTTITAAFEGNDNYEADEASYTITVNKPAPTPTSTTYTKVTSTADITDGEYLIVYEGDNTHASVAFDGALTSLDAAQNNVAVTINEGVIAGNSDIDAAIFTIDITAGTLQSASGKFIGVTSNSNGLKQENASEKYFNTFAIDNDGNAVITPVFENSTMALRYNYGSNDLRFRYYGASNQRAIALYKKDVATPDYGSYQRDVTNGNYGTICLPQAGTIEGATLFEIGSFENEMIYVDEVIGGVMEAGKPYIFQATADQLNVTYTSDTQVAASNANGLHGFYNLSNMATDEADKFDITKDAGNYILYQNAYWLVSGRDAYINNFRAYIKIAEIKNTPALEPTPGQAPRRRVAMTVHGEQVATGIDAINAAEAPIKVMINGQIYILRGEKMYDATGRLVK